MRLNRANTILRKLSQSNCQKKEGIHSPKSPAFDTQGGKNVRQKPREDFADMVNLQKVSKSYFENKKDENAALMSFEG